MLGSAKRMATDSARLFFRANSITRERLPVPRGSRSHSSGPEFSCTKIRSDVGSTGILDTAAGI
jgi:hypothetical protein